jgi:hypothetical protein
MRLTEVLEHKDGFARRNGWALAEHVSLSDRKFWDPATRRWYKWLPCADDHDADDWEWSAQPPRWAR